MSTAVDCQPNSEASYRLLLGSSCPQLGLWPSTRLNPACNADAFIRSYSLDLRGLFAAYLSRTSIGPVTPASVSSCLAPGMSTVSYAIIPLFSAMFGYVGAPGTVVKDSRSTAFGLIG